MSSEKAVSYEKYSVDDGRRIHDERGRELLDDTPMAPPVGYSRQPSLSEQIRNMVRSEKLRMEAEAAGAETFDEADDFDVGEDYDPTSPYEETFDPVPVKELRRRQKEEEDKANPPPPPPSKPKENDKAGDQPASVTNPAKPDLSKGEA